MAEKSYRQKLHGPPTVRQWHSLNPRRDGSPCVLKRKFGYVKTRHENLARVERLLETVQTLPTSQRHPQAVENLTGSVKNHRAWLMFSCQTLEEHCKFAVSRFDGSLDELKPLESGRKRGKTGGNGRTKEKAGATRRLVTYLRGELPTYIACCAVSARTSGQNEAMKLLMQIAKPVVEKVKRESGREPDVAEQLAWTYLFEKTATKFDPASEKSNMARFNTYFTPGARRATQIRTANDAPPGKMKVRGKFVTRGTLHTDEDSDSALYHPESYDKDSTITESVQEALKLLEEDERRFAVLRFVENVPLRDLAAEYEISVHRIRKLEADVMTKLQGFLSAYSEG